MSNSIIEGFKKETGLNVKEGNDGGLVFSTRSIYYKLEVEDKGFGIEDSENPKNPFRKWIENNMLRATDNEGNLIFTNYKQVKIYNTIGRPTIDYMVDEETAKMLVLRSNSPIGINLLKQLISFEKTYSSFMKQRLMGRVTFMSLTDSIKADHDPAKHYHYSNEVNMIYRIMFGMEAKELREARGVPEDQDLRDYFSPEELKILQRLEMKNAVYIDDGIEFQERKKKLIQWMADIGKAIEDKGRE